MRGFISIFLVSLSVFSVCGREVVLLQNEDGIFEELPQFLEPPKANQVSEYDSATLEVKKGVVGRKKYKPEEEVKKSYEWVEGEDFKQWEINCLMDLGKCNQKLENIKRKTFYYSRCEYEDIWNAISLLPFV